MTDNEKIIIEQHKQFSACCLWEMQRQYFDQQGVDAWVNQVPFYVTSNPFIANCYANLVIQFARDWSNQHKEAQQHPFYVMELGTGCGKFSFYVLKKIHQLRRDLGLEHLRICYIMSDFTKNNLKYWETQPQLQFFLDQGMLDFAVYNLENDEPITLYKQQLTLTPKSFVNPLTVFANYIFDTISQDAFTASHGNLRELLVTLSTDSANMRGNKPINWEKIRIDYQPYELKDARYDDEHFNAVLDEYRNAFVNTSFLFPIGGLRALKKLKGLANNKLFLVSSDKGYSSLDSMDHLDYPRPSFHGSFSMMANFHAIARYFKHTGGDYLLQTPRAGIKTVVCTSGFDLSKLCETALAVQQTVEGFSPADYFTLHRRISDSYNECHLEALSSHLMLSDWDPHIYIRINKRICSLLENADSTTVKFMASNMPKLMANFYYMPKADNLAFEIGLFFHTIKNYDKALEYYQLATPYMGAQFGLIYNKALCQHYLGQREGALADFKHALEIDPNSKEAKEWIEFIGKENAG